MVALLSLSLAVGAARAALVAVPPPDAREVAVLLCDGGGCADRMFWITHEPAFDAVPVVVVENLLLDEVTTQAQGEVAASVWRTSLDHARTALVGQEWSAASAALNDAEQALAAWRGTASNGELFGYWYMRGVLSLATKRSDGAVPMAQAAASAWNRSVTPPEGLEAWAPAYFTALAAQLDTGTGTLVIEAAGAGGPELSLDGVTLGAPPVRVLVFPGIHRLTALDHAHGLQWRADVTVQPGRTTTARPRFPGGDDSHWLAESLATSVDTRRLEPAVADLVGGWATRHGVRVVRLLRLDPLQAAGTSRAVDALDEQATLLRYTLREVDYQPGTRRFSTR